MSKNTVPSLFDKRHKALISLIETNPYSALEQLGMGAFDDLDMNFNGGDILCAAVHKGDSRLVRALISKGANPQQNEARALHIAIALGKSDILHELVYAKPDLSKVYAGLILTAHANGKKGIYNWLMEKEGVHFVMKPELMMAKAAEKGMTGIIDDLVARGFDVNMGNGAALLAAVKGRQESTVRHLFNKKAKANVRDGAAFVAAAKNDMTETVAAFLRRGVNPNIANGDALSFAVANGHHKIAKLLLKYGANPNVLDHFPLKAAIKNRDDEMVKLLIKHGALLNAYAGAAGEIAVEEKQVGIFTDLCDAGYNPLKSRRDLLKLAERTLDPLMEDCVHFYLTKYDYCQQPAIEPDRQDSESVAAARMGRYAGYVAQHGISIKALSERDKYQNTTLEILAAQGKLSDVLKSNLWRGREDELTAFFDESLRQDTKPDNHKLYKAFKSRLQLRNKIRRPKLG